MKAHTVFAAILPFSASTFSQTSELRHGSGLIFEQLVQKQLVTPSAPPRLDKSFTEKMEAANKALGLVAKSEISIGRSKVEFADELSDLSKILLEDLSSIRQMATSILHFVLSKMSKDEQTHFVTTFIIKSIADCLKGARDDLAKEGL
jgi:hypothetical protein